MGTRRARSRQRRENQVGPLLFDDREWSTLVLAAERKGLAVGAYIAEMALAVAREERTPMPVDQSAQLAEFIQARVVLNRVGNNLNQAVRAVNSGAEAPELERVLALVRRTVLRVEEAASAVVGGRGQR
ncbi:hypothetical protein GCM10010156_73030 [Planobispora rosea]|uniref:Bacterial mobilisation domain-containing protein n=1 Tax=Planobispora rosea TaxID=35762 RepID=A0A8J3SA69_PLARO|nr:plasmid mobilization relaxosome protein MobC [Planobispora rosea]GGT04609.1 hypothetical protein GCM10010156_73030 [Planobispora rosea]GIH88885.1 hypothetical protein Pro02_72930 [Planobispora rosea]